MAVTEERLSGAEESTSEGRILTVRGPVIDVDFPPHVLPEIGYALTVERTVEGKTDTITAEVSGHIGQSAIRAICMKPTDGLIRGSRVVNTGAPITVPVGPSTLGHVYNVLGEPVDGSEVAEDAERWA